jgi:hypothetical protein
MSDTFVIILVLFVGIGGLVGGAYFLDNRGKKIKPIGPVMPNPGPFGRLLLWIARILVAIMVLSIIGAFVFKSLLLVWITGSCLTFYMVDGIIYRAVRLTGK